MENTEKNKDIAKRYFEKGESINNIAKIYKLTETRVRAIAKDTLNKYPDEIINSRTK